MKRCQVTIHPAAEAELRRAFEFIRAEAPRNAAAWLQGIYDAIESLETMPQRCAFAREREDLDADVRQLLYHSHRILFIIEQKKVIVLHIRHAKMETLKELPHAAKRRRTTPKS